MKKAIILITAFLTIFVANAQETRKVGDFTKLNVRGAFDVKLVSGGDIVIKTKKPEILKELKTEVENGKLSIFLENNNRYTNVEISIEVPVKSLDEVVLTGSGSIDSDVTIRSGSFKTEMNGSGDIKLTVNADNVKASVRGSGDVRLKGKTQNFVAEVTGSGDLQAYGLESADTDITVNGSGDANVYASENLKARISGSGDISFRGNPKKEDSKVSGSGSIEKG